MENQIKDASKIKFSEQIVSRYTYAYFDHLHSEYLRVAPTMDNEKYQMIKGRIDPLIERRKNEQLTWHDVYTFDLEMLDLLSDKDLVRKAYDMRSKYRSIAGARDYDAYIASKPPDLTSLQLEAIKKDDDQASVATEILRADIRYLLSQFYLHYAMMPLREGLRDELTRRARKWTLIFVVIFSLLLITSIIFSNIDKYEVSIDWGFPTTVMVVIFAGIMGGCVSMLQRIQSAPNEGDSLYNLAALSHGWKGISLSPLYGAIFAMLLYVLFTAGILEGAVFPRIEKDETRGGTVSPKIKKDEPKAVKDESKAVNAEPKIGVYKPRTGNDNDASALSSPSPSQGQSNTPSATPKPSVAPTPTISTTSTTSSNTDPAKKTISAKKAELPFSNTAPEATKDYALLVIWSFISGFAERLVPDTLNRLVTKNQSIQGTNT